MKVKELIKPFLTLADLSLLGRVEHLHLDQSLPIDPRLQAQVRRLARLGYLRVIRDPDVTYELTDVGAAAIKQK